MHSPRLILMAAMAANLYACERPTKSTRSQPAPPEPAPVTISTPSVPVLPRPLPPAPPAAEDPFKKLDEAKAPPAPAIDPAEVQKEALRRARELRAEANRMRETL